MTRSPKDQLFAAETDRAIEERLRVLAEGLKARATQLNNVPAIGHDDALVRRCMVLVYSEIAELLTKP